MQVCQYKGNEHYLIGDVGSEGIYIDKDDKVYAYYSAPADYGQER